jgi:uroporphyrinogen-III synthase
MTLRALVTRPEEDAAPLAAALAERGVEVTVEPLLSIRPIPEAPLDLQGVQALLFTSANGARSLAALATTRDLPGWRELPAFAVGDASAAAAREAGFSRVESAGGDVAALARLAIDRLDPKQGALFHAAGSAVAGDLGGVLGAAGFTVRREMLYEAKPAEQLSPATVTALANHGFDLVLFFSPRTAATFVTLTRAAGAGAVDGCAAAAAVCLSPAVATSARELPWREIQTAARPELPALLDLIDRELAARARTVGAEEEGRGVEGGAAASFEARAADDAGEPMRSRRSPWWSIVIVAGAVSLAIALVGQAGLAVLTRSTEIRVPDVATTEQVQELDRRVADAGAKIDTLRGRVDSLRDDLVDTRNRLIALESRAQGTESVAPDVTGLTQRLDKLEGEIAALRTAAPQLTASAPGVTELTQRLDTLERQIKALRTAGPQLTASAPSPEVAALIEKIAALEAKLAAQQTQPQVAGAPVDPAAIEKLGSENAQLRNELGALKVHLDALNQAVTARGEDASGVAFVLAVGNLGSALSTGRPFAAELSAMTELAAKDPSLSARVAELTAPVAARATAGVPTLVDLRARFPQAARAIVDAAKQADAPAAEQTEPRAWYDVPLDWLSAAGDFVTSEVSVRPVGDVEGDDAGARVARAEVRLSENALAAAVAELEALSGAAAAAAESWLADARARLTAEQAVAALQAAAVTRLGSGTPVETDAGG